jgi:hypothetical protein
MPDVEHKQDELDPVAGRQDRATNPDGFNTDGADHGPAPMQSGELHDERFGGTLGGVIDPLPDAVVYYGRRAAPSSHVAVPV